MEDIRDLLQVGRVVELKNGDMGFVLPDRIIFKDGWGNLENHLASKDSDGLSIFAIYDNPIKNASAWSFYHSGKKYLELVWERKEIPKLEGYENTIMNRVNSKFEWIARDKADEGEKYGSLYLFEKEPTQNIYGEFCPGSETESFDAFIHIFQSITHENSPIRINDLL